MTYGLLESLPFDAAMTPTIATETNAKIANPWLSNLLDPFGADARAAFGATDRAAAGLAAAARAGVPANVSAATPATKYRKIIQALPFAHDVFASAITVPWRRGRRQPSLAQAAPCVGPSRTDAAGDPSGRASMRMLSRKPNTKPLKKLGDPYGNRTRVSAVKVNSAANSTRVPQFPVLFIPLNRNGLADPWEPDRLTAAQEVLS